MDTSVDAVLSRAFGSVDPALEFRYYVEFNNGIQAAFTSCTGFRAEREIKEVREGGVNNSVHKLPGPLKPYGNLTLTRGVMFSTFMWDWFAYEVEDNGFPANVRANPLDITIYHLSSYFAIPARYFHIGGAYPKSWSGANLNADSSKVAVESIELTFETLKVRGLSSQELSARLENSG